MMVTQSSVADNKIEKRLSQLEKRVETLEEEISRLKGKLDSHYIE